MSSYKSRSLYWPSRTVESCYDFLNVSLSTKLGDYTEGMYLGNPNTPYERAQRNQANYLLDQVMCGAGSRLLDIGCGNGRVLEAARDRGARATGITISSPQYTECRRRGLDVRMLDYRDSSAKLGSVFDCIIANGSIEHFVQLQDAINGMANDIYRTMFQKCHQLINASSESSRFVTTTIHFKRQVLPDLLLKHPFFTFPWGSDAFHFGWLIRGFGAYYPVVKQLERCAKPFFELVEEVDGTKDYHLTSEHWLRVLKSSFKNGQFLAGLARNFAKRAPHTMTMLICGLFAQSWNWQFRGEDPPMTLLRQTWQYQQLKK